jgi:multiple sugar transport system substrate-binding protein
MVDKLPEFENLTGIKVKWEMFPENQHRQKAPIELIAKNKDLDLLYVVPSVEGTQYYRAGWLHPLDGLLNDPAATPSDWDPADVSKGLVNACKIDGKQITWPASAECALFMYRKDIFEQKGVKVPRTLDEMEQVVAKVHEPPNLVGITSRGTAQQVVVPWSSYLRNFGGDYLTKDRKPAIASPGAVQSIEYFARLLRNYGPPGVTSFNWPEAQAMFLQGKAAVLTDGSSVSSGIEDPGVSRVAGKVGYAVFPAGPAGNTPSTWTAGLAISTFSEKKEAAWYFILWGLNKQNQIYTHARGLTVGRQSAWHAPEGLEVTKKIPDMVESTLKTFSMSDKTYNPAVVAVFEVRTRVGEVIVKALQGATGETLKAEAKKAEEDIVDIMARTEK